MQHQALRQTKDQLHSLKLRRKQGDFDLGSSNKLQAQLISSFVGFAGSRFWIDSETLIGAAPQALCQTGMGDEGEAFPRLGVLNLSIRTAVISIGLS